MCTEHYHEVYCADCLRTIGRVSTGTRIFCAAFFKSDYCTLEDYQLCKQARSMAPRDRPPEMYAHRCDKHCSSIPLKWIWRGIKVRIRKKLKLPLCQR